MPLRDRFHASAIAVSAVLSFCLSHSAAHAGDEATEWIVSNAGASVNSEYHDGWATMTGDGLTLYFASNRPGGMGKANREDHWALAKSGGWTHYDIYVAHRSSTEEPWGDAILLPETVNSPSVDHSAYVSEDGHYLFFASDRPGGCGELDLYVSYRENTDDDKGWQQAINLGCADQGGPNGAAIDSCPILKDGMVYFTSSTNPNPETLDFKRAPFDATKSSGGPADVLDMSTEFMDAHFDPRHGLIWAGYPEGGQGGSDLWRFANHASETDPAKWTKPVNLGPMINSPHEEHMPSATDDGRVLSFVSDRPGGLGGLDIYQAVAQ
ncbi:PD40 domain-containing protein [Nitratireductor sp. XY-223]|uniref:PD40 domain-containing protein n=1 Tax=Nitratireductor sp. XY-223 TaxID=2561926 RepID=UPI0010AB31B6|nr:PD40 domain-containing protein [Nitratireductor sp. XY-223]